MNKIEDKKLHALSKPARRRLVGNHGHHRILDAPPAPDGFKHRWIRAEVMGIDDNKNLSSRLREGFELVRADSGTQYQLYRKENTKVL